MKPDPTPPRTLILSRSQVEGLVTMAEVIEAVEAAHADMSRGTAAQPSPGAMSLPSGSGAFLTMTALVVISTLYAGNGPLAHGAVDGISKTNMAQLAFSSVFGDTLGNAFVAICLLFFAFSTIVGWNLFGRINVNYLFGKKANLAYSIIAIIFIFLGSCLSNDLVWELTDMFNQLMVLPNMIALVALSGIVAVAARKRSDEHELRK